MKLPHGIQIIDTAALYPTAQARLCRLLSPREPLEAFPAYVVTMPLRRYIDKQRQRLVLDDYHAICDRLGCRDHYQTKTLHIACAADTYARLHHAIHKAIDR